LLIGLFHAGFDYEYGGEKATTPRNENASMLVAQHAGHKVMVIDPR